MNEVSSETVSDVQDENYNSSVYTSTYENSDKSIEKEKTNSFYHYGYSLTDGWASNDMYYEYSEFDVKGYYSADYSGIDSVSGTMYDYRLHNSSSTTEYDSDGNSSNESQSNQTNEGLSGTFTVSLDDGSQEEVVITYCIVYERGKSEGYRSYECEGYMLFKGQYYTIFDNDNNVDIDVENPVTGVPDVSVTDISELYEEALEGFTSITAGSSVDYETIVNISMAKAMGALDAVLSGSQDTSDPNKTVYTLNGGEIVYESGNFDFSGSYPQTFTNTITYNSYTYSGITISGTISETYTYQNSSGDINFTQNGTLTDQSGLSLEYKNYGCSISGGTYSYSGEFIVNGQSFQVDSTTGYFVKP